MAELEPGHPDELCEMLTNWLKQGNDPIGSLPAGVTPIEWAVRNFIDAWRKPVRASLDAIDAMLNRATEAAQAGDLKAVVFELESAQQELAEGVGDELGIYNWNRDEG